MTYTWYPLTKLAAPPFIERGLAMGQNMPNQRIRHIIIGTFIIPSCLHSRESMPYSVFLCEFIEFTSQHTGIPMRSKCKTQPSSTKCITHRHTHTLAARDSKTTHLMPSASNNGATYVRDTWRKPSGLRPNFTALLLPKSTPQPEWRQMNTALSPASTERMPARHQNGTGFNLVHTQGQPTVVEC